MALKDSGVGKNIIGNVQLLMTEAVLLCLSLWCQALNFCMVS